MTASLWVVTLALGLVSDLPIAVAERDPSYHPWHEWPRIFGNNLMVGLLLYSGVATLGVTTVAITVLAGLYVGAVMGLAIGSLGLSEAAGTLFPFLAFELGGFMILAFAGLVPVAQAGIVLRRGAVVEPPALKDKTKALLQLVAAALSSTLPYLVLGVAALAVGATLEITGGLPR